MKMKDRICSRAFTLIELMIVVAIIGILAAVAIPKFAEMLRKSKEGATKGALTNLRSALNIYISDSEGTTPFLANNGALANQATLATLIPKYIDSIPTMKLGHYHIDTNRIICRSSDIVNRGLIAALYDAAGGGWLYTSQSGGLIFVSCIHSDTKNVWFTSW